MKASETFLFICSGIIVALGQPAWAPWLAPLAAFGGYALFWHLAAKSSVRRTRFLLGTIWFALIQLIQLSWMTSIEYQGLFILFVYSFLAIGMGIQFGLLTLLIDRIPFIATASFWTLMEWMRLYLLCGFSWNPIGLSLTVVPFSLQAASIFGVLGLSFWVILTNLACWKRRWKAAIGLALCPYLWGAIQWNHHCSKIDHSPSLNVALVQTGLFPSQKMYLSERASDFIPPLEQWERITSLLGQMKAPVDLVVLPEAAVPFSDQYSFFAPSVNEVLKKSFGKRVDQISQLGISELQVSNRFWIQAIGQILHSDVVIGMDAEEGGKYFSSAFFYSHEKKEIQRYDKKILLPLAEYIPFAGLKALTKMYGITEFFTHGSRSSIFQSKIPISTSICYEETFGHLMRQGRQEGAHLFVNITNDNWYPNSRLPKQHFDLAKVHAAATGTPLIRACNSGITSAIDSLGRIVSQLEDWDKPAVLTTLISLYHFSTPYTLWGDWGIVSISIGLLILCLFINRNSLFINNNHSIS